ncbi:F0F1 ATP synthase subunit B [Hymenobacter busanensis]|uniref:ATP synthase subunit b n=1 Tax=Hymenobacter busanensis TaxID=2607656 RepID=A0A7L4ZYR8_9BACT|nr:F0F1 ATP synthase subunit B [Hymenobacter busanensis]KAA9331474.1 F0F1 ATP synthase subunit B [Hymenobacter busanensis]QHJ08629.1 F0F1 ATP synthase subunit B [Hymenobacter busanensis]
MLTNPSFGLLFWQLTIFVILLIILRAFAWKPILASLREREESIEGALRQADQAKLEMQALKAGNEKLIAEARQERDRMLKEASEMSNQLIETAKQKATDEGARMIMQAREAIQNEKMAALAEVKNTAAQLSIDIAERILRRELSDSGAQKQLVTDYLQEVKLN